MRRNALVILTCLILSAIIAGCSSGVVPETKSESASETVSASSSREMESAEEDGKTEADSAEAGEDSEEAGESLKEEGTASEEEETREEGEIDSRKEEGTVPEEEETEEETERAGETDTQNEETDSPKEETTAPSTESGKVIFTRPTEAEEAEETTEEPAGEAEETESGKEKESEGETKASTTKSTTEASAKATEKESAGETEKETKASETKASETKASETKAPTKTEPATADENCKHDYYVVYEKLGSRKWDPYNGNVNDLEDKIWQGWVWCSKCNEKVCYIGVYYSTKTKTHVVTNQYCELEDGTEDPRSTAESFNKAWENGLEEFANTYLIPHQMVCDSEKIIETIYSACITTTERHYYCPFCGIEETKCVEEGEHTLGEWEITTNPTCYSEGKKYRSCKCGECKEYETIAMVPHNYVEFEYAYEYGSKDSSRLGDTATCTSTGWRYYRCTYCAKDYKNSELYHMLNEDSNEYKANGYYEYTKSYKGYNYYVTDIDESGIVRLKRHTLTWKAETQTYDGEGVIDPENDPVWEGAYKVMTPIDPTNHYAFYKDWRNYETAEEVVDYYESGVYKFNSYYYTHSHSEYTSPVFMEQNGSMTMTCPGCQEDMATVTLCCHKNWYWKYVNTDEIGASNSILQNFFYSSDENLPSDPYAFYAYCPDCDEILYTYVDESSFVEYEECYTWAQLDAISEVPMPFMRESDYRFCWEMPDGSILETTTCLMDGYNLQKEYFYDYMEENGLDLIELPQMSDFLARTSRGGHKEANCYGTRIMFQMDVGFVGGAEISDLYEALVSLGADNIKYFAVSPIEWMHVEFAGATGVAYQDYSFSSTDEWDAVGLFSYHVMFLTEDFVALSSASETDGSNFYIYGKFFDGPLKTWRRPYDDSLYEGEIDDLLIEAGIISP